MQISRRLGSVISILLVVALVQIASANIVIQHSGDADPLTEGFTTGAPLAGSPTISGGVPAWNIRDDDSNAAELGGDARYNRPGSNPVNNLFTPQQQVDFLTKGWVASFNVEVVSGSLFQANRGIETGFTVRHSGVDTRYGVRWGRKDPVGTVPDDINATGPDLEVEFVGGLTFSFPGQGTGFHRIDLVASPGSNVTNVYFDGTAIPYAYSGFAGDTNFTFGSFVGDQDIETGGLVLESNWNLVQFAVPEPASAGLLAIAGAAALGLGRNRC